MLKYLVILLDDNAISYCHYESKKESNLIPLETLHKGILFAMKHDMKIQYVLPKNGLLEEYVELIETMFHDNIGGLEHEHESGIIVIQGFDELEKNEERLDASKRYLVRTGIHEFFAQYGILKKAFSKNISINVVFKDIESFEEKDIDAYSNILCELAGVIKDIVLEGGTVNTNLLTDRIALDEMNNCGAGDTSITLAPDGKFYPCPAFYYDKDSYRQSGDIERGLNIRNKKLYSIEGAPLCKRCDAFHCKRCIWLNKKLTYEVNIPSRQQCVMAHIERKASKDLLDGFHILNILKDKEIKEIDYIDPFDEFQSI